MLYDENLIKNQRLLTRGQTILNCDSRQDAIDLCIIGGKSSKKSLAMIQTTFQAVTLTKIGIISLRKDPRLKTTNYGLGEAIVEVEGDHICDSSSKTARVCCLKGRPVDPAQFKGRDFILVADMFALLLSTQQTGD